MAAAVSLLAWSVFLMARALDRWAPVRIGDYAAWPSGSEMLDTRT